jgi:hypothetical protein
MDRKAYLDDRFRRLAGKNLRGTVAYSRSSVKADSLAVQGGKNYEGAIDGTQAMEATSPAP